MNTSAKNFKHLSTKDIIPSKCDAVDVSIVQRVRQAIQNNSLSHNFPGYKAFFQPETTHYKKLNKTILKNLTLYLMMIITTKIYSTD